MSDNERTIFDMIINPTYDETMALHEAAQKRGEQLLADSGYAIGDTVYIDAQYEGIITGATVDERSVLVRTSTFDSAMVYVQCKRDVALSFLGQDSGQSFLTMTFPVTIRNLSKTHYTGDNLKKWLFLQRYGLQNKRTIDEVPDEAI